MPKMRARVKMKKDVAGDRARRESVPGHILFYDMKFLHLYKISPKTGFSRKALQNHGIS